MITQSLSLLAFPFESSPSGPLRSTDPGPPGWMIGVFELALSRCAARLSPFSAARLYQEIALWSGSVRESVTAISVKTGLIYPLFHIRRRSNSNLQEVANSVHRLGKLTLSGSLCPKVCLRVGLR